MNVLKVIWKYRLVIIIPTVVVCANIENKIVKNLVTGLKALI